MVLEKLKFHVGREPVVLEGLHLWWQEWRMYLHDLRPESRDLDWIQGKT